MTRHTLRGVAVAPISEIPESICRGCAFFGSVDCAEKNATKFYEADTGIKIPTECPHKLKRNSARKNNRGESVSVWNSRERKFDIVSKEEYKKLIKKQK